ncbi:MAG TPA: endonuclease MutS2 [Chloroflexi bacterium]|nr:endonuclease MutS2 [Chloroflexota bacterium]
MLEFPRVLERLAEHCDFSASRELALSLRPTTDLEEARLRLRRTSEARLLLNTNDQIGVGGARDVRPMVARAARGSVLEPSELLDIKGTLIAARELGRFFEKQSATYPLLAEVALELVPPAGIVEAISRVLSDRGEVLDSASPALSALRSQIKVAYNRLISRLEGILNDPRNTPHLQEPIITQRNGRYVIPVRSESRGRIRSIVHDQSASGATVFVEPLVVVELNNAYHQLQLEERDEVRRILAEVSAQVGEAAGEFERLVSALAVIDLHLACARYAEALHASEPELLPFRPKRGNHPGSTIYLYQARHPLLDPETVVPIDVDLYEKTFAVVITGPNTGGKTVTLKTVGLFVAMAQSGLHLPAQSGSRLSVFENIFADIGDEQSIEQSLSTFSAHVTNIVRILTLANWRSLVLLDELGAGTDPQEGSALARAILQYMVSQRITCFVATHYPELKAFAHATPGVVNASMEFDLKTLRPTYRLTVGLPGRSNALYIAKRLNLLPEIVENARKMVNPAELQADDLLNEIHEQRELARQARAAAEAARAESEALRAELQRRLEQIEDERQKVIQQAREQAAQEVAGLRRELDDLRRELARARQPLDAIRAVQEQVEGLEEIVQEPVIRRAPAAPPAGGEQAPRPLRLGDKVRLLTLGMEGVVTALGENDLEVALGNLRVRARPNEVQRASAPAAPAAPPPAQRQAQSGEPPAAPVESGPILRGQPFVPSPGVELDLRGQRAEDALEMLERFLESAYLSGMPYVRIIHGKGTGRLRQVVREALQASQYVTRHESGHENEGGDGVTVAHLDAA